ASAAQDMREFYRAIHEVVAELMYARNFYITLYDEERQLFKWEYLVDEASSDQFVDMNTWYAVDEGELRGVTAFVLRTGEPQLVSRARLEELAAQGEIKLVGEPAEFWLGVPLTSEGRTVGVLAVQSYTSEHPYTEQDRDLLAFVGQHVGAALSRARAIEE